MNQFKRYRKSKYLNNTLALEKCGRDEVKEDFSSPRLVVLIGEKQNQEEPLEKNRNNNNNNNN